MNSENLQTLRHSCSHVLAAAVLKLYPKTKLGIGPAIDEGFYYDFQFPKSVNEEELEKISASMMQIIKAKIPFEKEEITIVQAKKLFNDQPYKLELIDDLAKEENKKVSIYKTGVFVDLCAGPHVTDTGQIGAFKLLSLAGAYWRGSEKNTMLTRIYGTCFKNKKELDEYLWQLEEAKKRDHRKIGQMLDLFSFHPEAPGDIFWHPKGLFLVNKLSQYWRKEHAKNGYVEVRTPVILTRGIWDRSGHTSFFIDKIYKVQTPDAKDWNMAVKPMNCDGHILIYKNKSHSYKEFPLRMAELGIVHRFESSGEVLGILRPREFTQDDAHIFCTPGQVKDELKRIIDLCFNFYRTFNLNLDHLELSTRPEKSIGSSEIWERAEKIMKQVLEEKNVPFQINEGEGAFYGPKFDFHLRDSIGRTWQCSTIQLDFAQPENFDLTYVNEQGKKERPVMIHRVIYGSIERFLGILIEQYAGVFPLWLSPVQAVIIPITDKQNSYGEKILEELISGGIRAEQDKRNETTSAKIRDAELQKVPYMVIVGEKEVKAKNLSVRARGETCLPAGRKDLGQMTLEKFIAKIKSEIENKA